MSKIDKLSILGVRSFDNTRSETIQFHSPLTLIVGYNGSGKTTIIECLKYATTGDLPPNSKGGAFIHDPKLCGEKEVLAQVKLSFKSTSGAKMVATRSLQLTVKKNTRQQKTLEGQLLMVRNGERTAISSRVAELDQMLPQYLGVSKAVLDSVIFCHQDESLWPMSEPAALKKKFDEIFEALKYTKAIDNIKQLRKKQNEELAKFKIMEQHAKEDKEKADKAEKRSRELSEEIEALREETKDLHVRAQEAGNQAREAWDKANSFTKVVNDLESARRTHEMYVKHLRSLQADLKERSESNEWLENELNSYEERVKSHEQRQIEQTKRFDQVKREIDRTRNAQSEKRVEVGKHEQQKANHERRIIEREAEIKESAREHNIRGYNTDLDDMQISEYMERITKLGKDQNSRLDRLRRDNAAEVEKFQRVLDDLREQRTKLTEGKKSTKDQISETDRKMEILRLDLDKIAMDEGGVVSLRAKIGDLEASLAKASSDLKSGHLEAKIREANAKQRELDEENASLNQELMQGTKQASSLARLEHLKKESKDRQRSLATMAGVHGSRLQELFGQEWSPKTIENDFQLLLEAKRKEVVDAERQRDGVNRELEQVDFKIKTAKTDLKNKETEMAKSAENIRNNTQGEPEDYPENLLSIEHDRDTRKEDVNGYEIMRKWFKDCIDIAESEEPACRLCTRPFSDKKEIKSFIKKLEHKGSKGALEILQKELKELDAELQKAKDAGTSYDTWLRLSEKEIPAIKSDIAQLETQRGNLLRQIEEHDRIVNEKADARRDAETLSKPVTNIAKYNSEYESYEDQIRELASNDQYSGSTRTLEDIQDLIGANAAKSQELRNTLAKLQQEERQYSGQITSYQLDLEKAKNSLSTADHELEQRGRILAQIDEYKIANQERRLAVDKFDAQLESLQPKFAEENTKLNDLRYRNENREKAMESEARGLSDSIRSLMRAEQDIKEYLDQGGPAKLTQAQREIQRLGQEIATLETEQKQIIVEINKIKDELSNHEQSRRIISDNLKFRNTKQDIQALEDQMAHLSAQNAEADQAQFQREAERWEREHRLLSTNETSKMGTMKAKDDQLMQLLNDWNTDYKDAATKYKRAHIEVETTKAAVEDLGRYGGALDKAIMKYHSLKMEEINRIIEELWKKTYQGTDVDTILIRSDNETGKGNRSYNYRVCMVKQDAEMDMRGRCSAGQKVLASILIRLALAECFGVNCGLIALDEPTTNLDRDNIRSLAESLHDIIRARQQQSNFQLIVITHDEEFLRYMKVSDFCDSYYRVSRNDMQKSIIERQSIADVL